MTNRALTISEQQKLELASLVASDDVIGYWSLLQGAGDRYAGLARGVAEANTSPGNLARAFAKAVGENDGLAFTTKPPSSLTTCRMRLPLELNYCQLLWTYYDTFKQLNEIGKPEWL